MNRRNLVLICSIAITLGSLPGAAALWSSRGSLEPDYLPDVEDGFMFLNPDVNPSPEVMQIYFNGYISLDWSGVNPNVGATGSSLVFPGFNNAVAFLGVWKDCNFDGYIGMAETAVLEYNSALLTDPTACPEGTSFNRDGWVYEFLAVIDGTVSSDTSKPTRYVNATDVRVWGENGLAPAEQPNDGGSDNTCFTNQPRGFAYSTGSILDWGDCLIGHTIVQSITQIDNGEFCIGSTEAELEFCEPAGTALNSGLGFDGECRATTTGCENGENAQCTDSLLNQRIGVWDDSPECPEEGYVGLMDRCADPENRAELREAQAAQRDPETIECSDSDPNAHSAFTVWDCSSRTEVAASEPTGTLDDPETEDDEGELVNTFAPGGMNPTVGFLADQENNRSVYEGANSVQEGCDYDADAPWLNLESDVEQGDAKVTNDFVLTFAGLQVGRATREGERCDARATPPGGEEINLGDTAVTNETGCTDPLLRDVPHAAGLNLPLEELRNLGLGWNVDYWSDVGLCCAVPPNLETRGTGTNTSVDGEGPSYSTFYAYVENSARLDQWDHSVSPSTWKHDSMSLLWPNGQTPAEGTFGFEWCRGADEGIFGGFDCDPTHWYVGSAGGSARPSLANGTKPQGAIPGEPYNLRDVDCYDGSVAGRVSEDTEGVGMGLTILDTDDGGPCRYVRG